MSNNELKSKWPRKLWRFFVRLITYQFVFFWIYVKYSDFSKHAIIFKNKSYEALHAFTSKSALVDEIFTYPEIIIRLVTLTEAILFLFTLFGRTSSGFWLSLITGFNAFIYNNPFVSANLEKYWFGLSPDFMLGIGVSLAIMVSAIRPHCCDISDDEYNPWELEDEDELENEDDDNEETENDRGRNISSKLNIPSKKVSQKKKKN